MLDFRCYQPYGIDSQQHPAGGFKVLKEERTHSLSICHSLRPVTSLSEKRQNLKEWMQRSGLRWFAVLTFAFSKALCFSVLLEVLAPFLWTVSLLVRSARSGGDGAWIISATYILEEAAALSRPVFGHWRSNWLQSSWTTLLWQNRRSSAI